MNLKFHYFQTSIGQKLLVAITGLGLIGFLLGHVSGNLLIFAGPEAINAYAEGLRAFPGLLWIARIGLIGMFVLHMFLAIRLNLKNKAARNEPYRFKATVKASFASKTMVHTGILTLLYVLYHLAHFTFRSVGGVEQYGPYDVYAMVVESFQNPVTALLYILSMVVLGLHLSHGIASVFQTMGLTNKAYRPQILKIGPAVAWAISLLYISIPLAVLFGLVK